LSSAVDVVPMAVLYDSRLSRVVSVELVQTRSIRR
jgi:hypothetical protein